MDIRKYPSMKDKGPTAVSREGPDPQPGIWPEGPGAAPLEERMVYPGEGMVLIEKGANKS